MQIECEYDVSYLCKPMLSPHAGWCLFSWRLGCDWQCWGWVLNLCNPQLQAKASHFCKCVNFEVVKHFFLLNLLADAVPLTEGQTAYWPSPSVLTARLRRLITASQRYTKSRQILHIHQTQSQSQQAMILSTPLCPLPPTLETLNPKMAAKIERQQRSEYRLY